MRKRALRIEDLLAILETAVLIKEDVFPLEDDDINEDMARVSIDRLGATAAPRDIAKAAKLILSVLDRGQHET